MGLGSFVSVGLPIVGLFGLPRSLLRICVDAVLVSACLAGIRRSTGLSPALGKLPHKELRHLVYSYLELGEWAMDISIMVMGRSSAFERRRIQDS